MSADRLVALIEDFRSDLETELPLKLHKRSDADPDNEPIAAMSSGIGWTGLPFTPPFQRYLGHPDGYGYEFIAAASFDEIRDYCRRKHHEEHRNPEPFGSLCKRMAVAVVELRQPLAFVAAREGIGVFAARKHLEDVLTYAAAWRAQKQKMAVDHDTATEAPADPIGDMLRREHDEATEERVWNRLRTRLDADGNPRYPNLPEWPVERQRRIEEHRKLGCPRCMTIAA